MPIASKNSGKTERSARGTSHALIPKQDTVSAMQEARSMHLHRFTSAKELFDRLDKGAQQNQVAKKLG